MKRTELVTNIWFSVHSVVNKCWLINGDVNMMHCTYDIEFSRQSYEKYSNIKFNENPPIVSQFVPYGQTETGR